MSYDRPFPRNGSEAQAARAPRLRWHRRIGLSLAVFFAFVVVTGVLLNHAEWLGLRHRSIHSGWIYRWYGMQPTQPPVAFAVGERWIVGLDHTTFLDARPILDLGPLLGAANIDGAFAVASENELALFDADGELIERVTRPALPPGSIMRLGMQPEAGRVALETDQGTFTAEMDSLVWEKPASASRIDWSTSAALPPELEAAVIAAYRGEGLNLHRLVLDLHTGRFFGAAGEVMVDVAAFGMLFLATSGVWYALARKNGRR